MAGLGKYRQEKGAGLGSIGAWKELPLVLIFNRLDFRYIFDIYTYSINFIDKNNIASFFYAFTGQLTQFKTLKQTAIHEVVFS